MNSFKPGGKLFENSESDDDNNISVGGKLFNQFIYNEPETSKTDEKSQQPATLYRNIEDKHKIRQIKNTNSQSFIIFMLIVASGLLLCKITSLFFL